MPIYSFQCLTCGLRFDRRVSRTKKEALPNCFSCGSEVQQEMPEGVNFTINQSVTGPVPQNSGFSSIDANVDRVIGKDAEEKWKVVDDRNVGKREAIHRAEAQEGTKISRNPDGSYRVMDEVETEVSERVQLFNNVAMSLLKSRRRKLSSADH